MPTDVRCVAGLFSSPDGRGDDVGSALTLDGNLPRRCFSSIVAACNKSNSPSLRCPTAFFKFFGRTCRGDTRLFTALATTREEEGGFSDGEGASRSDGCENRSGVVGRVRAAIIFRPQAKPNAPLETSLSRVPSCPMVARRRCRGPRRFVERQDRPGCPLGYRGRLKTL
jgi:hypothetical protein